MKLQFAFALLFSTVFAFAQTNKKAEKTLEDVRKKTEAYTTQTIVFENTIDAPTGKTSNPRNSRTSSGKALIKGDKFRIELGGIIFINDGKTTYIVYPDDQEINKMQGSDESMNLTPSKILSTYETGFSMAMAGKENIGGKAIIYVRLKPKASADVKEIMIGIDKKADQLYSFTQYGQDGVITTFKVKTYVVNTPLKDDLFSIKAAEFKGFEIYAE